MKEPDPNTPHYKCLACGTTWRSNQLFRDPVYMNIWTCGNLFCGGRCIAIAPNTIARNDPPMFVIVGNDNEVPTP